jgi:5-methylcytosine-specific restriction endonuclease McrA
MATEYQPDTFPLRARGAIGKGESRIERRQQRDAEARAAWTAVCKQVDARDHSRCRSCGKSCDPKATTLLARAHRHHIVYRSAGGEDVAHNVVTLCASCHDQQHRGWLDVRGNATHGIELWQNDGNGGWFLLRRETAPFIYEHD